MWEERIVHKITRDTAEAIINNWAVLDCCKCLEDCFLIISLRLSNQKTLIVQYDMKKGNKSYFLKETSLNHA